MEWGKSKIPKKVPLVRTSSEEEDIRARRVTDDARLGRAEMERDSRRQLKQDERKQLESVKHGACVCE